MNEKKKNLTEEENELLSLVPEDGSTVGNVSLRRKLNWDDEKYWKARDGLKEQKLVTTGRGKGGAIRLAEPNEELADAGEPEAAQEAEGELALYDVAKEILEEKWLKDENLDQAVVAKTAMHGKKATGGKWTRPDITVIYVSRYKFVPGIFLEVVTFEIKAHSNLDVTAVYEALAHRRAATQAYVLAQVPAANRDEMKEVLEKVEEEAVKHGVGLIIAADMGAYDTWEFRTDAERVETEPKYLDAFIDRQIGAEQKAKLLEWLGIDANE